MQTRAHDGIFANSSPRPSSHQREHHHNHAPTYSDRSANIGSTPAARPAGTYAAINATAISTAVTARYVRGSAGLTSTSIALRSRLTARAATRPTSADTALTRST